MRHTPLASKLVEDGFNPFTVLMHVIDTLDTGLKMAATDRDLNNFVKLSEQMLDANDRYLTVIFSQEEEETDDEPKPNPIARSKSPIGFDTNSPGQNPGRSEQDTLP